MSLTLSLSQDLVLTKGVYWEISTFFDLNSLINAAKMTRTSTELPRLEPESSASTNSAMAADNLS